jgi:hypothetical protein
MDPNLKTLELLYEPDEVNAKLFKYNYSFQPDKRVKNIYNDTYKFYLYDLILIEFVSFFYRERNTVLRKKIKSLIEKADHETLVDEVAKEVFNFYNTTYGVKKEIEHSMSIRLKEKDIPQNFRSYLSKDLNLLETQLKKFAKGKESIENIDETFYDFDLYIHRFICKKPTEIKKELKQIAGEIFELKTTVDFNNEQPFPNLYISCMDKSKSEQVPHCDKKKLIVPKPELEAMLDVLAFDITNRFKLPWFSSLLFGDRVYNFFKFNQRANEHITIAQFN